MKIRDFVDIRPHPTVVRLDHLNHANADWISAAFHITPDVRSHLNALRNVFTQQNGCGIFVVGQYGSGKSHFLAYLAQQLRSGLGLGELPHGTAKASADHQTQSQRSGPEAVIAISLLNYRANESLEDIIAQHIPFAAPSRKPRTETWSQLSKSYPRGLLLIIDELSEFLRSKPQPSSFHEDIRFLQFLGEWAQNEPLWIIGAMQEQIEHVGDLEYDIYRKIKDRYPLRCLLTPSHIVDLLAESILVRKSEYEQHVAKIIEDLQAVFPNDLAEFETLRKIFPLHPVTLEFLEEVRDSFSQARGAIDFTVGQLGGRDEASIRPFLDEPSDHLLTPDAIVDHFADLFELQPDFVGLAQKLLPYYRKRVPEIFPNENQQSLVWKLLKLLILVHISPSREGLSAQEAVRWLYFRALKIDTTKNQAIIERTLLKLTEQGRFVEANEGQFRLNLRDDGGTALQRFLDREKEELRQRGEVLFESLVHLLADDDFHPFGHPQDRWLTRQARWRFHDRSFGVFVSGQLIVREEANRDQSVRICVRLPWGAATPLPGVFSIIPSALDFSEEWIELAALANARKRHWPDKAASRLSTQLADRLQLFRNQIRNCYQAATLVLPQGNSESAPQITNSPRFADWLEQIAILALRRTFPSFERFAPVHGPIPLESIRQFMQFLATSEFGSPEIPTETRMIIEAYLVPMKLVRRNGRSYAMPKHPENAELVRLVLPLVASETPPQAIYEQLQGPVYGLVTDQITLLLIYLLSLGEIDIRKGKHSYWDFYDTLPNPIQYDRILPGQALKPARVDDLVELSEYFKIQVPQKLSVMGQRRVIELLRERIAEHLGPIRHFQLRLTSLDAADDVGEKVATFLTQASVISVGGDELHAFQQLIFQFKSTKNFLDELQELSVLAQKADAAIEQKQRMLQLLSHPVVQNWQDPNVRGHLDSLGDPPGLGNVSTLEAWLAQGKRAYTEYCASYQRLHQQWWQDIDSNPCWNWSQPTVMQSRHIGLQDVTISLETTRRAATGKRCQGLVNLEFQPVCHCEFDGQTSPIAPLLQKLEHLQSSTEESLRLFFGQPKVRQRMRDWIEEQIEINADTLAYVDEKAPWPQTDQLALLDQHLAGIAAHATLDLQSFVERLQKRTWSQSEAIGEWKRFLGESDQDRLRFQWSPPAVETPHHATEAWQTTLVEWCLRQTLQHGIPLPKGIPANAYAATLDAVTPSWVSNTTLSQLESLDLPESLEDQIAEWVLDGHLPSIPAPPSSSRSSLLCCVREVLQPTVSENIEDFAHQSHTLYRHHFRMRSIAPKAWRERMEALAQQPLGKLPQLVARLANYSNYRWLLVDALGLPLLPYFQNSFPNLLPGWQIQRVEFASVSATSTTDQCYRDLLDGGVRHPILKCNSIDELIHERFIPLDNFWQIGSAELSLEMKAIAEQTSKDRNLIVFADHGFRISADGTAYIHGGNSTLERTVPVILLSR